MAQTRLDLALDLFLRAEKLMKDDPSEANLRNYGESKAIIHQSMKSAADVLRGYAMGLADGGQAAQQFLYTNKEPGCRKC